MSEANRSLNRSTIGCTGLTFRCGLRSCFIAASDPGRSALNASLNKYFQVDGIDFPIMSTIIVNMVDANIMQADNYPQIALDNAMQTTLNFQQVTMLSAQKKTKQHE